MQKSVIYTDGVPSNITSFMTTRLGGYSTGNISAFSFGLKTVDETKHVLRNYRWLEKLSNISDLTILYQIHSDIVLDVTHDNKYDIYMTEADGLFTAQKDIALGVLTADCYPVHIWGEKCVSVLHCGWRSANIGIIENALKLFDKYGDKVVGAHIGTGICKKCYEIQDDMYKQLNTNYQPEKCVDINDDKSYQFDLRQFIMNIFSSVGIQNYTYDKTCSCCDSDLFYSYRRDKGVSGRMISVIMQKG